MKNAFFYMMIFALVAVSATPWLIFSIVPLIVLMFAFFAVYGFVRAILPINKEEASEPKRNPKVLLVDDEPSSLTLITHLLRRQKCDFIVASSPHEALEMLKKDHFDMMFLDYHMPDMNGREMLSKADATLSEDARMPVVMFSGDDIVCSTFNYMHNFNMVDCVKKQTPTAELEKIVDQYVHGRSGQTFL